MQMRYEVEEKFDIFALLQETALFLWKDWSRNMEAVMLASRERKFNFRGDCPHCQRSSVFVPVTSVAEYPSPRAYVNFWIVGMQCQGCMCHILGIASFAEYNNSFGYYAHYPLGKPDDTVAEEIPEDIRLDYQEALRCQWVEAYNATVEMCRRAIESTCLHLGVPNNIRTLSDMIDWAAEKQHITLPLKATAHKVRLGGDRGAHPPQGVSSEQQENQEGKPVVRIEKDHADAVVGFTAHFLHHVYVVPQQLDKYDFSRTKPDKAK
jgi:hypothetical protein